MISSMMKQGSAPSLGKKEKTYIVSHFYALSEFIWIYFLYRYSSMSAYGQSKIANILHANELTRRLKVTDPPRVCKS